MQKGVNPNNRGDFFKRHQNVKTRAAMILRIKTRSYVIKRESSRRYHFSERVGRGETVGPNRKRKSMSCGSTMPVGKEKGRSWLSCSKERGSPEKRKLQLEKSRVASASLVQTGSLTVQEQVQKKFTAKENAAPRKKRLKSPREGSWKCAT